MQIILWILKNRKILFTFPLFYSLAELRLVSADPWLYPWPDPSHPSHPSQDIFSVSTRQGTWNARTLHNVIWFRCKDLWKWWCMYICVHMRIPSNLRSVIDSCALYIVCSCIIMKNWQKIPIKSINIASLLSKKLQLMLPYCILRQHSTHFEDVFLKQSAAAWTGDPDPMSSQEWPNFEPGKANNPQSVYPVQRMKCYFDYDIMTYDMQSRPHLSHVRSFPKIWRINWK